MAEATDRPAGTTDATAPAPAAPPPAAAEAPKPYSSLSILAVVGFTLAVLYAAVMAVGEVVALVNHSQWILPLWTFVFPLGAAAVCWVARGRVRSSEGALTGARLTAWGAVLSLAVGGAYAAYYAGTYFAVTSQAAEAADRWMDLLKKDQLDKAYLTTLLPPRPADDDNLRDRLELEHDNGPLGGDLTLFRQMELVRQFEQGGEADKVQLLGVQKWGYESGGFNVDLTYRVSTPCMSSEVTVTAVGIDSQDESGERQWAIRSPHLSSTPVVTPEGERMSTLGPRAEAFADDWLHKVTSWQWADAYLDTLPPPERERQAKERGPDFDKGLAAFRAGSFVRYDPAVFWAGRHEKDPELERQKQEKAAAVFRGIFGRGGESPKDLRVPGHQLPIYHAEAGRVRLGFDVPVPLDAQMFQARLFLTADGAEPASKDWRIESVDLISAKTAGGPAMVRPPPNMATPAAGGRP